MQSRAFDTLGIDIDASRDEVRRAWRRLAKKTHPDVDGSPEAARRFKTLRAAYREALRQVDLRAGRPVRRSRPPRPSAPPRARFRYACPCCDDTYAIAGDCSRCAVPLHDEQKGRVARQTDPAVQAFIEALESPAAEPSRWAIPEAQRPAALVAGLVCLGGFQASVGLVGLAVLSIGFALTWVAAETHGKFESTFLDRWRRSA